MLLFFNTGRKTDIMPFPGERNEPQYKRTYQNDARKFWLPDANGLLEIPYKFVDGACKIILLPSYNLLNISVISIWF